MGSTTKNTNALDEIPEIRFFQLGLLDWILQRIGLLNKPNHGYLRRVFFVVLICWIPLFVLCLVEETALGGEVSVSFLQDWTTQIRLLIVIPLFLLADIFTGPQLNRTIRQFQTSGLVDGGDDPQVRKTIRQLDRATRSRVPELLFLTIVVLFIILGIRKEQALGTSSWMLAINGSDISPSAAGTWFSYVCIPVYQFILFNWIWGYLVWSYYLWRTSRLNLHLSAMHPDRAGGLGFLGIAQASFAPFILGFSVVYASLIAKEIILEGSTLLTFTFEVIVLVAFILLVFLLPLTVFSSKLARLRVENVRKHSAMASSAARTFESKWLEKSDDNQEALLGSSNIDAMANLSVTFANIKRIKLVPVDVTTMTSIAGTSIGPMLPLFLTVYTPAEIFDHLKSILL